MTDSQSRLTARAVRILACFLSGWGVLLLIDPGRPENDAAGYLLLILGPLVMLGARFLDPRKSGETSEIESAESLPAAPPAAGEVEVGQESPPEASGESAREESR